MATVSSLFIYPIKSCQGLSVTELRCDQRGPVGDRRVMVVDDHGRALTQRENPRLSLVAPYFRDGQLVVAAPNAPPLRLPESSLGRARVQLWSFDGEAEDLGDECANWFSTVIEQPCRLVRFARNVTRKVSQRYTQRDAEVAFADGYPLLVLSLESLTDLNQRLSSPLPMNRFRPNLVLRDCQPFQEDDWKTLAFPGLTLDLVKPCVRCKITTLNPETLEYGKEPLRTLAKFRRTDDGVIFGQNAVHHAPGVVRIGDRAEVLA